MPDGESKVVALVHKLLFDLIDSIAGANAVVEIKRCAGVPEDRTFRMDAVYDDEEWRRLLAATCEVLHISQEQAEEAFAESLYKDSIERWPVWFQMAKNSREFLVLQPRIHNGFATGIQDPKACRAINEKFQLENRNGDLVMRYRRQPTLRALQGARQADHQSLRRQRGDQ